MRLVHGSPKNIYQEGGFKLLNYKFDGSDPDNTSPHSNDMYGPGIYTFVAEGSDRKSAVDNAHGYAGNGGFIHFCSVNAYPNGFDDDEDLSYDELPLNLRESDEISPENWREIIIKYIELKHLEAGYDEDNLESILMKHCDSISEGTFDEELFVQDMESVSNFRVDLEDYEHCEDGYEWKDEIMSSYEMEDPASQVDNNGGISFIIENAISGSQNLWEVISKITSQVSYYSDGTAGYSDTGLFTDAFFDIMDRKGSYEGAFVFNDAYYVCFDTRALSLEKVIQVKTCEPEIEHSI